MAKEQQRLEAQGRLRGAKAYGWAHEADQAINMYTKARRFDDVLRFVAAVHSALLADAQLHLAREFDLADGDLAEYLVAGGDRKSYVSGGSGGGGGGAGGGGGGGGGRRNARLQHRQHAVRRGQVGRRRARGASSGRADGGAASGLWVGHHAGRPLQWPR